MKLTPRHILIAGLLVILAALAIWKCTATTTPGAVRFTGDWHYRWEQGGAWQPYLLESPPERGGHTDLWLETTIPDTGSARQALFIPAYTAFQSFEVRMGDRLLYRSGMLPAGFADRHRYLLWHLIDLPANSAGTPLIFHFSSTHHRCIGLIGPVWLGEPFSIQKHFVMMQLPVAILAALFILVGVASLAAARFFTSTSRAQLTAFAQTALGAGCYLFSESTICQMVIDPPVLASYLHYLSFFLFVTGFCRYFEPLTGGVNRTITTRIYQLFAVYPLLATLLDLSDLVSWDISFSLALQLVMVVVCWFAILICSPRFKTSAPRDAALIRAAFIPLFIAGLFDAATGLQLIGSGPLLYPWGLLVLMCVLFYRVLALDREEREAARLSLEKSRRAEETAIDEERRRIARDIHDGVAQDLAMMNMRASVWEHLVHSNREKMTEEIKLFRKLLHKNIGEVRRAIFAMRPVELDELGFSEAVGRYVKEFGQYTGLRIDLEMAGDIAMPRQLELELYRIIQESLNNIAKHAGATEAGVRISDDVAGCLTVSIADNGKGFDLSALAQSPRLGLRQMKERVERRNGTFLIDSGPGRGAAITICFPITITADEGMTPLST
ncbi:sensor histidine kinase [Geotalea uraniireducens]|uniref:Integral membrane sensor signal transduction histidine kinase n=1 Tax=Geotalea uraniireducens (strain Rf4) TaxID=351605 RepID=A5GBT2_GEOUR|nr:sensor histidine kinase [Geotalea uraniireducens]ABQ24969.1 integral membrane sensor signal transduction histidine kinase [Geotalea uraniireducens Rf4]